jgi:hypothetical protein
MLNLNKEEKMSKTRDELSLMSHKRIGHEDDEVLIQESKNIE